MVLGDGGQSNNGLPESDINVYTPSNPPSNQFLAREVLRLSNIRPRGEVPKVWEMSTAY